MKTRYHYLGPKGHVPTCVQVLKQYELGNLPEIKLLDEELSEALEYVYKTEAKLVKKFNMRQKVEEIAVEENGILYCKSRILEGQTIKVVGGMKLSTDLESMLGLNFKVPLIKKRSPLALPHALHIHDIFNQKGSESTYRFSL